MDDGIKQRVVGAVVLSAAAVVLWSVLFTSPTAPVVDRRSQIPPAPAFERYVVKEPEPVKDLPQVDTDISAQPAASTPVAVPAKEPSTQQLSEADSVKSDSSKEDEAAPVKSSNLTESKLPVAWVIQVVSLKNEVNANKLKSDLQAKGFKAYTETVGEGDARRTRVYVGPKLSQERALAEKAEIDKAFKVDSLVTRFRHR